MGLSSVFNTAVTGLQASETMIDVAGNNVANSNTIGFKKSEALFSTQFLQTLGLGSAPSDGTGGTNPRQIGLGTQVQAIRPDFTQGTIAISSNPSDLALQGDGFFIVRSSSGEQLYTRNGKFELNSQSELVSAGGERLLGFGIDDNYQIQSTTLQSLTIPLGSAAVAKPTENVYLQGTLTPTGAVAEADKGEIIASRVFSDGSKGYPTTSPSTSIVNLPSTGAGAVPGTTPGSIPDGTYRYKFVYVDASGNESTASTPIGPFTVTNPTTNSVDLTLPAAPLGYTTTRIYRTDDTTSPFTYDKIADIAGTSTAYTDIAAAGTTPPLTESGLIAGASYSYYVTWYNSLTGQESRPVSSIGAQTIGADGQKIALTNIPQPPTVAPPASPEYDQVRIYRSLGDTSNQPTEQFRLTLPTGFSGTTYIDGQSDASINNDLNKINLDGPPISLTTSLKDLVYLDGSSYVHAFQPGATFQDGTFTFTGRKGDRALTAKSLAIDATTNVQDLADFMEEEMGIQAISGNEGGSITPDSRLQFIGNTGADNKLEIRLSGMQFTPTGSTSTSQVNMAYTSTQAATGQSAVADFVAYDSLGIAVNVRVTTVLESRTGTETVYRWFADSGDNDPRVGNNIAVGSGTIKFDGEGKFISASNSSVAISREHIPSTSPMEFELDFTQISGLSATKSTLSATRQDGFPPGKLTSYLIGEDGKIRGVFDNGTERDLGQIVLARFANPSGLEQRGQNLYSSAVNSGLPVTGKPGDQGIGTVVSGAVEQSNTDISKSLIDLISASTQYRGNARVITAAQQLLDELLNLRR
ncbi:MAG: flagellar hook-basal body complex protein [Planctomycetia bacterium]|nr:flagellar hook-basal body complex protein [Planctomycetia bacterium]